MNSIENMNEMDTDAKRIKDRRRRRARLRKQKNRKIKILILFAIVIIVLLMVIVGLVKKNAKVDKKPDSNISIEIKDPEDPRVRLEWLLNEVEKKDLNSYSEATVEILMIKYEEAKTIYNNKKSTEEEILDVSLELLLAIQRLQSN